MFALNVNRVTLFQNDGEPALAHATDRALSSQVSTHGV
jgi:hypothetical protein